MDLRPPLHRRLTFAHWVAIDALVALLLAAALFSSAQVPRPHLGMPAAAGGGLALGIAATVVIRRWRPLFALVVALAASLVSAFFGFTKDPMVALALVMYMVAVARPPRVAIVALAVVEVAIVLGACFASPAVLSSDHPWDMTGEVVGTGVVQLAAWTVGVATRQARAYSQGLREQAERQAQVKVEQARRAISEERLRIARELHDAVAHSMSVIAVQAGVGHYVIATRPEEAAKALAAIETTSRAVLQEMRGLLGVLRDETPGDGREVLPPVRGVADLPALAEQTTNAGVRVSLQVRGVARALPPGVDLAAYRIVQEALTNVVRHAETDHGRVLVTYGEGDLEIEVTDDGLGADGYGGADDPIGFAGGHGLVGVRERVALYGGDFSAGPLPLRGFRVAVRIPTDAR
ncbi:sensor histidine kinase [Actinoallomurus soli]|uniref:sensor histidine kinase n=1 Tax=Actinoallomurus soli TaxID=2952535 RepID=UPI0020930CA5|nr:sensor histidine kinase [Actinoallomurus soli]MCO5974174.1 sensor histidine kinase [Actinoallomurus soli]